MTIQLQDMIAELRRELRRRQISYPTLIKRGALTEAAANRQNARLQAIKIIAAPQPYSDDPRPRVEHRNSGLPPPVRAASGVRRHYGVTSCQTA